MRDSKKLETAPEVLVQVPLPPISMPGEEESPMDYGEVNQVGVLEEEPLIVGLLDSGQGRFQQS